MPAVNGGCVRLKLAWPGTAAFGALVYDQQEFAWPRLLHALSLAWLVAAFVPRNPGWMQGRVGSAMALLGRHSLEGFCLGLFLSHLASTALQQFPGWFWLLDPAMAVAGVGVLLGLAWWLERKKVVRVLAVAPVS